MSSNNETGPLSSSTSKQVLMPTTDEFSFVLVTPESFRNSASQKQQQQQFNNESSNDSSSTSSTATAEPSSSTSHMDNLSNNKKKRSKKSVPYSQFMSSFSVSPSSEVPPRQRESPTNPSITTSNASASSAAPLLPKRKQKRKKQTNPPPQDGDGIRNAVEDGARGVGKQYKMKTLYNKKLGDCLISKMRIDEVQNEQHQPQPQPSQATTPRSTSIQYATELEEDIEVIPD